MSRSTTQKPPAVKGLTWHRDQFYSFFIPNHWHKTEWTDGRNGVLYAPDPADPLTIFAVDWKDLGMPIGKDDLDILAEGFFQIIEQLPDCNIEYREQKALHNHLQLEVKYTFREDGHPRKRWARVYYHMTRQIAITAQGSTPEKFDYWLPWFFEALATAKVHQEKPTMESLG